jgi:hypothetical protein
MNSENIMIHEHKFGQFRSKNFQAQIEKIARFFLSFGLQKYRNSSIFNLNKKMLVSLTHFGAKEKKIIIRKKIV